MEGGESMDIRITEIRISLRDDEKLKAFVAGWDEGAAHNPRASMEGAS